VMASTTVALWGLETGSLSNRAGGWISVLGNTWVLGLGMIGIHLPLRLPDGRLPSSRWRWFSRVTIVLIAISFVGMTVQPGQVQEVDGTSNPLGSETLKPLAGVFLLVILCFIGGVAALVQRYRRSGVGEREQLRWVAFAGLIFLVVYIVSLPVGSSFGEDSTAGQAVTSVSQAAFAALPIGIGYAILRQGLYDIDAVISRTLSYGALTATLGAAYLGCVLLLQLVLSPSSDFAVAGSTLAVAALFRPARTRIQSVVDRRFNRHRYDAQRTLEGFGSRLRDEVDLDALGAQLRTVVAETMQPQHVSVWVRPR